MLSLWNVGSSQDAGRYYEKADDYYTKDKSPSQWHGKAAEVLGLRGEVSIEDFKSLLDGNLPNGEYIKLSAQGHRGGTDLTFSAPKSVSMQALIGEDHRLIDAHDKAVARTLRYAEGLVGYRQTIGGEKTKRVLSGNFIAATFRHELSRACDPQLHTHCVVLNITQREDGKWRAMDNELIYRQKMLMGAMYRAELAREIQRLGYEIRITHPDGRFELSHIEKHQLDLFSQRSQAIEEVLKQNGKTRENATAQEKQLIVIATRPKKTEVDRKFLKEYWLEKSQEAGLKYDLPSSSSKNDSGNDQKIRESVKFAIAHTIERQAIVTEAQIIREALQIGTGKAIYAEVKAEIERQVRIGNLIQQEVKSTTSERTEKKRGVLRYTTPEAIAREQTILQIEKEGRETQKAIFTDAKALQTSLQEKGLNEGQSNAAHLILTTKNRIVGIQGLAGTGKTFMLSVVHELAERQGYRIVGLAPTAAAAKELSKTGIKSQTITSFQAEKEKPLDEKSILVIDEAGMVSVKQLESLLKTAQRYEARVVLVGDTQQLKAVEAGRPFAQLQDHGMATAGMGEIQRQKNPELKVAVKLAAMGEVKESVALLQKSVLEIKNKKGRYAKIAKDYLSLSEQERKETIVLSGTNEARRAINEQIRKSLGLQGKGITVEIFERKNLTQIATKETINYQMGNFVIPERNYQSLNLKKGEFYKVSKIYSEKIILQKPDGSFAEWHPRSKSKVSVYSLQKKEIASGDLIRITKNDPGKKLINGEVAKILSIDNQKKITLQKEDGKIFQLDGEKPLHLEYGYCSTVHSAQGRTCEKVMIEVDTKSPTTAQDSYYVAISRARQEAKIYTNNRENLPEAISRENTKQAALDIHQKEFEKRERPKIDFGKWEKPRLESIHETVIQKNQNNRETNLQIER